MITLNYDKMMFKEMSQLITYLFSKGFEKGNLWDNIFPTSVVFKWSGNQSLWELHIHAKYHGLKNS